MKIGYARVSTEEQNLDLQIQALEEAGCEAIYSEKISGTKSKRPEFDKMLSTLRKGDRVLVWKLDRLGRSTIGLINTVNEWHKKGIHFQSLTDNITFDESSMGKLVFHLFAAIAEHERNVISERTKAGLAAARKRGRKPGRKPGLSREAKKTALAAAQLYTKANFSVTEICNEMNIARSTLYKYLRHEGVFK